MRFGDCAFRGAAVSAAVRVRHVGGVQSPARMVLGTCSLIRCSWACEERVPSTWAQASTSSSLAAITAGSSQTDSKKMTMIPVSCATLCTILARLLLVLLVASVLPN